MHQPNRRAAGRGPGPVPRTVRWSLSPESQRDPRRRSSNVKCRTDGGQPLAQHHDHPGGPQGSGGFVVGNTIVDTGGPVGVMGNTLDATALRRTWSRRTAPCPTYSSDVNDHRARALQVRRAGADPGRLACPDRPRPDLPLAVASPTADPKGRRATIPHPNRSARSGRPCHPFDISGIWS